MGRNKPLQGDVPRRDHALLLVSDVGSRKPSFAWLRPLIEELFARSALRDTPLSEQRQV